jgi:hypothetical protein
MKKSFVIVLLIIPILSLISFSEAVADYFTSGNVIRFSNEIANGVKRTNEISIVAVNKAGGRTTSTALCKVKDDAGKYIFSYKYKFALDSNFWYSDILNEMQIAETPAVDVNVEVISEMLAYPLEPVVGDTLQPARGSSRTIGKSTTSESKYSVINRKVVRKESVTVPAGTFTAYVVESKAVSETISDYGPMGRFSNMTVKTITEWFVPGKGVVKANAISVPGAQILELL